MEILTSERAKSIKTKKNKNLNLSEMTWSKHLFLDPSLLYIDTDYQRKLESSVVQKIINNFNPKQFGAVKVASRKIQGEKTFCVVDGQHRTIAAYLLELEFIPCLHVEEYGQQQEASLFNKQKARKNLTPFDIFKSAVISKEQPQTEINEYFEAIEVKISNSSGPRKISFVSSLIGRWKKNKKACKESIKSMLLLNKKELSKQISGQLHGGFFYLEDHNIRTADMIKKVYSSGGHNKVQAEYNSITALLGANTKGQEKHWAQAILNIYNKNKRTHKIYLDSE